MTLNANMKTDNEGQRVGDAQKPNLGFNIKIWSIQAEKRLQGEMQHQEWLYSGNERVHEQGLRRGLEGSPRVT